MVSFACDSALSVSSFLISDCNGEALAGFVRKLQRKNVAFRPRCCQEINARMPNPPLEVGIPAISICEGADDKPKEGVDSES